VRSVKRRFIALVDFVEIIEIIRSLAFMVNLRHLGGEKELTKLVSPAPVANSRNSVLAVLFLNWNRRSRFSDWLRAGLSEVRIATGENVLCSPEPSRQALGVKRPGREV
jgi:hypothetical protein